MFLSESTKSTLSLRSNSSTSSPQIPKRRLINISAPPSVRIPCSPVTTDLTHLCTVAESVGISMVRSPYTSVRFTPFNMESKSTTLMWLQSFFFLSLAASSNTTPPISWITLVNMMLASHHTAPFFNFGHISVSSGWIFRSHSLIENFYCEENGHCDIYQDVSY